MTACVAAMALLQISNIAINDKFLNNCLISIGNFEIHLALWVHDNLEQWAVQLYTVNREEGSTNAIL